MIRNHIKKILGINDLAKEINNLKEDCNLVKHEQVVISKVMQEFMRVDADVGVRENNTIILTGVVNGNGYVKFYDLGDGEFGKLVAQLNEMKKYSLIRNIDAPPTIHTIFNL